MSTKRSNYFLVLKVVVLDQDRLVINELSVDQVFVLTIHFEKLHMSSALNYLALIHDENLVCLHDGAQAVGDDHYSLFTRLYELVESLLNLVFALSIEG